MLNVQTEHLENHTARLTVEIEQERLEQAMRQTARRLAKRGRIPGFRPGKAPYNVVLNLYGREYVLSEALEKLGNEVYREALESAEIEPYAPGSLENVEDDGQKLVFVVPKQPTVELGNYRDVRVEFEPAEVTDEMVSETLENMREGQAINETVERPSRLGDLVTFSHIEVVLLPQDAGEDATSDEDEPDTEAAVETEEEEDVEAGSDDSDLVAEVGDSDEADDAGDEDEDAEADEWEDDGEEVLIHQHNWERVLRDDDRDLFPGFSAELVGLSADDEKTFTLAIPEDFEDDERLAGRTLRVEAHVDSVQSHTLPEWSDNLAKTISEEEFETILELRMDVRENLQKQADKMVNQQIAEGALEKIVAEATIHYPDDMTEDYIDDLLRDLDGNLRNQGLTLEDFKRITGQSDEQLRDQYRERAGERVERTLVMGEFIRLERLAASEADVDAEIDQMTGRMGEEQSRQFRQFLNAPRSRMNIQNQLIFNRAFDQLAAIAKGENPPMGEEVATTQDEAVAEPEEAEVPAAVIASQSAEDAGSEEAAAEPATAETSGTDESE